MRPAIQRQLMLPLLETMAKTNGKAKPADLYEELADRVNLTPEERSETFSYEGRALSAFGRQVRWTRQTAVLKGYLASNSPRNLWELADPGHDALLRARPGVIVTVIETGLGKALWASFEDSLGIIEDGSVDLVFCSPPYVGAMSKDYGTWGEADWLAFMGDLADGFRPKLAPGGSAMINLGSSYIPGKPAVSTYIERFTLQMVDSHGYQLLDRLFWHNPNRLPSPFHWVATRRLRLKPSVEPILWFSPDGECQANNARALQNYAPWREAALTKPSYAGATGKRASGHKINAASFLTDNGGSIRPTLVTAGTGGDAKAYSKGCREDGIPAHPARMPNAVPRTLIPFAVPENAFVWDPFGGSGPTAEACELSGRRWMTSEIHLASLAGARHRFPGATHSPLLQEAVAHLQSRPSKTPRRG